MREPCDSLMSLFMDNDIPWWWVITPPKLFMDIDIPWLWEITPPKYLVHEILLFARGPSRWIVNLLHLRPTAQNIESSFDGTR
jgi:hypothetical protein